MTAVRYRVKLFLKRVIHAVLRHPSLKNRLLPLVKRFPNLYVRLKRVQYLRDHRYVEGDGVVLSEEGLAIYRELAADLRSSDYRSKSDS